jgi:hypothetical protein
LEQFTRVLSWMVVSPAIAAVFWLSTTSTALGAETVREVSGSTNSILPDFEVNAPWILEWQVTTDGQHQAAVDVLIEQAGTDVRQGSVLNTSWPGTGVRLFDEGGKYHFRVSSSLATWHLRVVQLTPEEAKAYTPRIPERSEVSN